AGEINHRCDVGGPGEQVSRFHLELPGIAAQHKGRRAARIARDDDLYRRRSRCYAGCRIRWEQLYDLEQWLQIRRAATVRALTRRRDLKFECNARCLLLGESLAARRGREAAAANL